MSTPKTTDRLPSRTLRPRRATRGLGRRAARWTWPPDKWERLSTVAALAGAGGAPDTVLDLGGRGTELSVLLPHSRVLTANVEEPCDVVVAPGRLPFDDASFAVVTSTDVLEHVPGPGREEFLTEAVRVARDRVVLCFPAGSPAKDAAEKALAEDLAGIGVAFGFLDEHIALGLPRAAEVLDTLQRVAPGARVTGWWTGGLGDGDRLLLGAMRLRHRGDPRGVPALLRAWVRRPAADLLAHAPHDADRVYVVVDLDG